MSNIETFQGLIRQVTDFIGSQSLDKALQEKLNQQFPYNGEACQRIVETCRSGVEEGWMCQYEGGGVRYGRVIKPSAELHGYSVDVVDMNDLAGPHHRHPNGEIDLIMPISPEARFDGQPGGWLVYGPDSAHSPTVTQGRALVLYLLPEGKIEFTRQ
ncbi:DUF4863 family protein [Pusillimonas noertemannii]|uniref:Uncharacterized protein DUF4863 n=1 Tax=Pusillimonas noertemannii TaxID=305977 RepID=A0A2U1CRC7_9BURK|nr:DUF4863 family protein [Pusillimonas noertemannii]NYT67762.1 DUF4863 family protein [Pusillimonas noertemannii]PVY68433.1 uncharacterized protein DUF4863 [Pusillimonas noertemannii]TFL12086.1 DUF4863 family protein [Pusillimonas noertemannii]